MRNTIHGKVLWEIDFPKNGSSPFSDPSPSEQHDETLNSNEKEAVLQFRKLFDLIADLAKFLKDIRSDADKRKGN